MKRIALAFGTVAMGLSSVAYAQVPATQGNNFNQAGNTNGVQSANQNVVQQPVAGVTTNTVAVQPAPVQPPPPPRPYQSQSRGYSLYGGPEDSRSYYPERHGTQSPHFSPLNKIPGVPDDITAQDEAREARRNAGVEFGMFRNQFTGSTQFWMDHDRTRLAKVRYAMDEPMFRSIHPDYDWGDGGYMYNTAASVGGPQWPGSSNRVIVTPPQGEPTVRNQTIVRSNQAPVVQPAPPIKRQTTSHNGPLVASDRGE